MKDNLHGHREGYIVFTIVLYFGVKSQSPGMTPKLDKMKNEYNMPLQGRNNTINRIKTDLYVQLRHFPSTHMRKLDMIAHQGAKPPFLTPKVAQNTIIQQKVSQKVLSVYINHI